MSSNVANSSDNEELCVVCFRVVEIFSIGVCDHAVCFECSTRMRVLCKQNECPICRQDLPKVIFSKVVEKFAFLFPKFERSNLQDRKFGVFFCTSDIQKEYQKLLEHRCYLCEEGDRSWPFKTFQQLKDHMRREHELFYCDICVENLKIFTFEKKSYTRQELAHHRRKGDPDNTSHRGHPLCEFCDTRFMDSEELFRHLRRIHLFCHFCDADGKHQFYNNMNDLVRHFREEHFLCQEGECKASPLTAVFRTDIDCRAHIATEHSRFMSKSATKHARTLELEFTLAPRSRTDNTGNKRYNERREREEVSGFNLDPGGPSRDEDESNRLMVNQLTPQNFPALGGATSIISGNPRPTTSVNFTSKMSSNFSNEDFPTLGGSRAAQPAVTITTNSSSSKSNRAPEVTITRSARGAQGLAKTKNNFPALGGPGSASNSSNTVRFSVNSSQECGNPKVSIQVNHRPNGAITTQITTSASTSSQQRPTEAFPVLGKSANVNAQTQWVQVKSKKQETKNTKVAEAPQLPPSNLEQFPTLSKKKSSVSVPVSSNWVNLNSMINDNNNKNNARVSLRSNGVKSSESSVRKNEVKSSSSQKQNVENKMGNLKIADNNESKSKNKKKKNKNVDTENSKPTTSSNTEKPSQMNNDPSKGTNNVNNSTSNGLVKKRSELKIGTLTNPADSSDFPTQRGETKPPPGFKIKPPPGLTPAAFPSLGVANDLTFTSSSGQSYSIMPCNNYSQPTNFHLRNQNLIKRFMKILNNEAIKEFKTYSDLFRNGGYPTSKYYEHCKDILMDDFEDLFPELLVLLPDVEKQQDLYRAYEGRNKKNLIVCENCKQVIYKRELSDHYNYHVLDNQFPSLGKAQQVDNVWKNYPR